MRKFTCPEKDGNVINARFIDRYGFDVEAIYTDPQKMAEASYALQQEHDSIFCALPLCHTTEAEGFGAKIIFTPHTGAKSAGPVAENLEDITSFDDWDMERGRFAVALQACRILKEQGKRVIFNITGPCGILNCLLPSVAIFLALRGESEELESFYASCQRNLLRWSAAIADAGADCISYSDPIAAGDMLGPKYSKKLADEFICGFLEELQQTIGEQCSLIICPKTGLLLGDVLSEEEMPEFQWRKDRHLKLKAAKGIYCCCAKSLQNRLYVNKIQ